MNTLLFILVFWLVVALIMLFCQFKLRHMAPLLLLVFMPSCGGTSPVAESASGQLLSKKQADQFFGLGEKRDAECMRISLDLLRKTMREGRTAKYSGRAHLQYWKHRGKTYFHVMRECNMRDGSMPQGMDWGSRDGGIAATGYHTSGVRTFIYGPTDYEPPYAMLEKLVNQ